MFTVLDVASLEGRRKPIARAIGARALKLNRFDSQPLQAGFATTSASRTRRRSTSRSPARAASTSGRRRWRSPPAASCWSAPTRRAGSWPARRA
jgi:hypothetical protein